MADAIILEVPDVTGECQLDGYTQKIVLTSFNHGMSQPMTTDPTNQERTVGRVNCQDLTASKYMDSASVPLINAICTAKNLGTCKVYILKATGADGAGQTLALTIEMSQTMISSYSLSGGGGPPMETFTFNFNKIVWNYTPQKEDGSLDGNIPTNWNLALGKKE
jgi:type VI secretion system secreted protein Hcp